MSDWNERANDIFLTAVEISDPAERLNYIAISCQSDPKLRREVDDLLNANAAAGSFLESPFSALPPELMATGPQLVPERIGRYRIREELGEGGMGVVHRAEQEEPIKRDVAVKIIKPGLDTRQVIARFEAERQVLAMMDHPGIARVFDGGATEAGRPYFVMELVTGMPVTDFCNQEKLPRKQRLELFIDVCTAVQHAHQKGIIHRDLKPSNILVTRQDGRPAIKIIDFGVAKAISSNDIGSALTRAAQWVGTPLYMSPEQASPVPMDVDTRTDVYALGVILYELLTGTTPFDADTLDRTSETETRRIIREEDPPYPSARVTSLDSTMRIRLTGDERIDARKLSRQLRGELDWIVIKALEKDRERRYDSVSELSADIQRYLNDEPVSAGPPSQLYRLRKAAWRFRRPLTTAMVVVMALVFGIVAATWQAVAATRARNNARKARFTANLERDKAEQRNLALREVLYSSEMRRALDAWRLNDARTLREILDKQIPDDGESDERGFAWHYMNKQAGVQFRQLLDSSGPMHCLKFTPDGRMFAAAGAESRVYLFNAESLKLIRDFTTGQTEVNSLVFSPDSKTLYTAGDDGTIGVWDADTCNELQRRQVHDLPVFGLAVIDSGNGLVTGARDALLKTWKLPSLEPIGTLPFHQKVIQCIAESKGGLFAAGSDDYKVSVWKPSEKSPIWNVTDRAAKVSALAFSPDGEVLATGHMDGLLTLREVATGALLGQRSFPDPINSLAFSPPSEGNKNSRWLAVGDRGGIVHLLPMGIADRLSELVSESANDQGREWQAHKLQVYGMSFTPDGSRLLTVGHDGKVIAWDYAASQECVSAGRKVDDFVILGNDRVVTTGNRVHMSMLKDGRSDFTFSSIPSGGKQIALAPETRELFFDSKPDQIFAMSLNGGNPRLVHKGTKDRGIDTFAVSADGACLAVEVLQPDRVSPIGVEFPTHPAYPMIPCTNEVHQLKFAPDGRLVLDQIADVWIVEPATGKNLPLKGHTSTINDFDFSPDGRMIVTVSSDRTVRVWSISDGQELWSTVAHPNESIAVAWMPDSKTIVTGGIGGEIKLWRWKQGLCVLELSPQASPVHKIGVTPDGMKLLVEAQRGLYIYDATPQPERKNASNSQKTQ